MSAPHHGKRQTRRVEVAIMGAGFGGLCMAIQLLRRGERSLLVLEKGQEVGGTWRDNTYPGCACDVQSHLYSFSFAPKPDWSQRYAPWHEIQQYILDTTARFGVRRHVAFGQEVVSAHFDERAARWRIRTAAGLEVDARYFVVAAGPLHHPHIPELPGIERFRGKMFHSARWDHTYDLRGKRVVSVGTGGSAVQYVPEIAPQVERLSVLQRSAAWVIPRDTRPYSTLEQIAFRYAPALRRLHRARLYWSNESRVWPLFDARVARALSAAARQLIRRQVHDPVTRRKLTPDYTIGCKRVLISNDWYPVFNRPNVELVTDAIREVREGSVVTADGTEREADCILFGTGFITDPRQFMAGLDIRGLGGRRLLDDWRDGAEAFLGVSISGFPNLFMLVGPNTGLGHNSMIFMIEAQVHYALQCMTLAAERGASYLDVRAEVQRAFNERLQAAFAGSVWATGCSSWYQQADGKNVAIWPYSTWRYWLLTRHVDPSRYRFQDARTTTLRALPAPALQP